MDMIVPFQNDDGTKYRCEIVRALREQEDKVGSSKEYQRFVVSVNDGEYEEIVSYSEILDHILRDNDDDAVYWRFKRIAAHQGPLDHHHILKKFNSFFEYLHLNIIRTSSLTNVNTICISVVGTCGICLCHKGSIYGTFGHYCRIEQHLKK